MSSSARPTSPPLLMPPAQDGVVVAVAGGRVKLKLQPWAKVRLAKHGDAPAGALDNIKVDGRELKAVGPLPAASTKPAASLGEAWERLGATVNRCSARDLHYDYWPNGGVRNFYCHAISVMTWRALTKMSGVKPFLRGPHNADKLSLHSPRDFGRYNPAFVRWLVDNAVPAAGDAALRERTQGLYEQYVRELARTYYVVHEKLQRKPEWRKRERELYLKTMDEKNPDWSNYYDKHSEFLGDADDGHAWSVGETGGFAEGSPTRTPGVTGQNDWGGYDPNLQSASVAFWLRRDVDGTAPLFLEGLQKLLRTYDTAWIEARKNGPPPKAPGQ